MSPFERSFEPANAKRASVAAAPLAEWVTANVRYAEVLEKIAPLEEEEKKLMRQLRSAQLQVEQMSDGIVSVEEKVAALRKEFEKKTKEASKLETKLDEANEKLNQAAKLLKGLSKEKERWKKTTKEIERSEKQMSTQSLLAAAHIVFLSSRPEIERVTTFNQWKEDYRLKDFNFLNFMTTEAKLLEYHQKGMPNDTLSLQNCASMLEFTKPPLIIDQSGRAQNFVRNYFEKLKVIDESDNYLQSALENAIRFGETVMVENIASISPFITELLRFSVLTVSSRPSLKLGEKVLDVNPNFKLILSSKTFTHDEVKRLSGMVVPIIFSMTRKGLEHQLLSIALKAEEPQLEEKMNSLVEREEDLQLKVFKVCAIFDG